MLCVGLDPEPSRLPSQLAGLPLERAVRTFCESIIEATADYACAYKPNLAFFEALGRPGLDVLADVVEAIPKDRIIIADGKRGDIGNTARRYADAIFNQLGCDSCTVNGYMGREAVEPFLAEAGWAAFVLVKTSNLTAGDVQDQDVGGAPLWRRMADLAADWGEACPGQIGFVVGATDPTTLAAVRSEHPHIPLLIPGVGAQGGDPAIVIKSARPEAGPIVVNSSRGILYAGSGPDFAEKARNAARELRDALANGLEEDT